MVTYTYLHSPPYFFQKPTKKFVLQKFTQKSSLTKTLNLNKLNPEKMLLQSTFSPSPPHSLTSQISHQLSYPSISPSFISFHNTLNKTHNFNFAIKCSISQVHNYGTLDYESRPPLKWNTILKRISNMDDPQNSGVSAVLSQVENEGKKMTKWELCRIVRELRKFRRYKLALEVYEWMINRIERFKLSSSDTAIQLDLIAKVRGVTSAEDYFTRVPDTLKDKRIYGALLNAYVGAKIKDKAETLMERMRNRGYAIHALPYNVMMTLYMKLNEFDKVEELISEMKQKRLQLDLYTYNIWLSACGSRGSAEDMERVYEELDSDPSIVPNWTTFSTMAALYMKLGRLEKAEQCLKKLETRITGRDKMPYHYLISLYGSLGNIEEVYRVWNIYKSIFPNIPNWGYHSVISSLVRLGDIKGAELLYEEWLSVKSSYDPKVGNLLMGWYSKEEPFEKVKGFFDHITEAGGKPNASSWEILGDSHIREGRISEALACFKEGCSAEGANNWRPKPSTLIAFLELCEQQGDHESKEAFVAFLNQMGWLQDKDYRSLLDGVSGIEVGSSDNQATLNIKSDTENEIEETDSDESEMLLSVTE